MGPKNKRGVSQHIGGAAEQMLNEGWREAHDANTEAAARARYFGEEAVNRPNIDWQEKIQGVFTGPQKYF
jgi:hypothetical protein